MSTLVDMLVPALVLSALALAALRLVPDAPPTLRLGIALAGLAAWVVPWPLLHVPLPAERPLVTGIEPIARLVLEPGPDPGGVAAWPVLVVAALLAPGLVLLGRDWARFRAALLALRHASRPAGELRARLPADLERVRVEIRAVPGTRVALASGVRRPTIWIGDGFASDAELDLALAHECTHVRRRDPFWITLITIVERAYWWNPLVGALSRQAALMIEAACDRRCAERLGHAHYIGHLAALMLDAAGRPAPLVAAARGARFDVQRLKLLSRPTVLGARGRALLLALAAAGAVFVVGQVVVPAAPGWSRVAIPATPAGHALTALLDAYDAGDTLQLARYLGAYTPQEIAWPLAGYTEGVEVVEIVASEPRRIEYLVRDVRDGSLGVGRLELAGPP